jgi:hypothetical protein
MNKWYLSRDNSSKYWPVPWNCKGSGGSGPVKPLQAQNPDNSVAAKIPGWHDAMMNTPNKKKLWKSIYLIRYTCLSMVFSNLSKSAFVEKQAENSSISNVKWSEISNVCWKQLQVGYLKEWNIEMKAENFIVGTFLSEISSFKVNFFIAYVSFYIVPTIKLQMGFSLC